MLRLHAGQAEVVCGIDRTSLKSDDEVAAATDAADRFRRVAHDEVEIVDVLRDQGSHPNHGESTDGEIVANDAAGADRGALP